MAKFLSNYGIFFDAIWTEFLDEQFFSWMQTEAIFHKRCITRNDIPILSNITDWMNTYGSTTFTLEDICDRFELAILRFNTWKSLTNHSCIQYDEETLSITTTPDVWDMICKEFELETHYRHYPMERMWHELNSLFGPDEARRSTFIASLPPKPERAFPIKFDPLPTLPISTLPTIDEILQDYEREETEAKLRRERRSKAKISPPINHYPFDRSSSTKRKGIVIQNYRTTSFPRMMQAQEEIDSNDDDEDYYNSFEIFESSVWPRRNAKRNLGL